MKAWEVEQIRRATQSKWLVRPAKATAQRPFTGRVCTDSRQVKEGDLFIALAGKRFDAHDFLSQAVTAGAAMILVHRVPASEVLTNAQESRVAIMQADDTIAALNRLASAYRNEIRAKVIAVGGSNGKTTTKRILHTLLGEKLSGHASPKSFNNNIGMPLTLLEAEPAHDYVVLEIGTNAPGEIAALGSVARPDIAVITSIGLEHLEQLGDLEGVAREEAAIVGHIQPGGTLVTPADAPLSRVLSSVQVQRITVGGPGSGADLEATDITEDARGVSFTLTGRVRLRLGLLGEHNAQNALLAIAVARRLGLSEEQIQAGLNKVQPAPMRLEPIHVGHRLVLNDAYNANPSSMAASLKTFARLDLPAGTRRVAILGDMLELGSAGPHMHRELGRAVASLKIPVFMAVGPAMKEAARAAKDAGGDVRVTWFADISAACIEAPKLVGPDDAVLLKGSRGMTMEKVLETLAPGNAPK